MKWRRNHDDVWTAQVGPFAIKIEPTRDGRFSWSFVRGDKPNPEATGIGTSLGAAKTACEMFVKRSGLGGE